MTNGSTRFKVVGLGELLWDLFPDGKQLGGALVAQVMKNDGIEHLFGLVDRPGELCHRFDDVELIEILQSARVELVDRRSPANCQQRRCLSRRSTASGRGLLGPNDEVKITATRSTSGAPQPIAQSSMREGRI